MPDAAAILKWDVKNWSCALDCWDHVVDARLDGQTALEVGAGTGGLSLYLAARGCCTVCSDFGDAAAEARAHHQEREVRRLIDYARADATSLPFADASFDIAAYKSILGGIGRHRGLVGQAQAVAELHRVLKPGGLLLFADNLRATWLHQYMRRTLIPWGHDWRYPTLQEFRGLFDPFSRVEIHTFGIIAALGRSEGQRAVLHYVDRVLSPVFPAAARYIGYGYAVK